MTHLADPRLTSVGVCGAPVIEPDDFIRPESAYDKALLSVNCPDCLHILNMQLRGER